MSTIKPKIWITTDTHLGHDKMREYCFRPADFEILIFNGLMQIKDEDILIHLGDFCIGMDAIWHTEFMKRVKCKKILVKGNHDKKTNTWYLQHGWDFVCDSFSDKLYGKKILFSHKPSQWDMNYELNIHGHCHNATRYKDKDVIGAINDKQCLVAIENTNYQPKTLTTIINEYDKSIS